MKSQILILALVASCCLAAPLVDNDARSLSASSGATVSQVDSVNSSGLGPSLASDSASKAASLSVSPSGSTAAEATSVNSSGLGPSLGSGTDSAAEATSLRVSPSGATATKATSVNSSGLGPSLGSGTDSAAEATSLSVSPSGATATRATSINSSGLGPSLSTGSSPTRAYNSYGVRRPLLLQEDDSEESGSLEFVQPWIGSGYSSDNSATQINQSSAASTSGSNSSGSGSSSSASSSLAIGNNSYGVRRPLLLQEDDSEESASLEFVQPWIGSGYSSDNSATQINQSSAASTSGSNSSGSGSSSSASSSLASGNNSYGVRRPLLLQEDDSEESASLEFVQPWIGSGYSSGNSATHINQSSASTSGGAASASSSATTVAKSAPVPYTVGYYNDCGED